MINNNNNQNDKNSYKVVNGKKTSYFHHEMTEEEKRLIGDITPQRIDLATQVGEGGAGKTKPNRVSSSVQRRCCGGDTLRPKGVGSCTSGGCGRGWWAARTRDEYSRLLLAAL
jgi:hypothetical protein